MTLGVTGFTVIQHIMANFKTHEKEMRENKIENVRVFANPKHLKC